MNLEPFELALPRRVLFGPGRLAELTAVAREMGGGRCLLVTGKNPARAESVRNLLEAAGSESVLFPVRGEPTLEQIELGLKTQEGCGFIVGFGGGSAIDAAKAIAIMSAHPGSIFDYLEVIGKGAAFSKPARPWIAIPTTAGTGAEVTRNSVLGAPEHELKVSLRSRLMLAHAVIVDPELTFSLPGAETARTGLDALTQLIEAFVSRRANALTDAWCQQVLPGAADALLRACQDPNDQTARAEMSLASLFGGLALSHAGLGAVHGFAGPIGGMTRAPHGAICAALLPHVFEINRCAVEKRCPGGLGRFRQVARWLTGHPEAEARDGVQRLADLTRKLRIPTLAELGVQPAMFARLIQRARASSSMKGNPIALEPGELQEILERA